MPLPENKRDSSSVPPQRRRSRHTARNIVIAIILVLVAAGIFLFGINKWRIDFAMNGDPSVTCECGNPYKDAGATAEVTGSILDFVHYPVEVAINTEGVNIHEPGTYTVTFTASFLWMSTTKTRKVVVVDTTPPVIELQHKDDYYTLPHHAYVEEGFTATDNHDGDITGLVTSQEKDGVVYYSVSDKAGNTATAEREIFYDDRNAPVLAFPDGEEGFLFQGETWNDGVTADDDADGDVTAKIEISDTVNTNKVGTYTVKYTVSDEWGNVATAERLVTVKRKPVTLEEAFAAAVIIPVTEDESAAAGSTASTADKSSSTASAGKEASSASSSKDTSSSGNEASSTGKTASTQKQKAEETVKKPEAPDPEKVIYLTFDDGPGMYTEELLKILDSHKVLATFFVTAAGDSYRDLIGAEYKAGHSVAIHTASHQYSQIYSSSKAYWADFSKMEDIILEQTGARTDLFRFPGGSSNTISADYCAGIMTTLTQEAAEKGYTYFDWNVASGDAGDTTDENVLYENMMNGIHTYENSIILCHDLKDYTVKMMDRFITDALKEGYTFLPLNSESPKAHHNVNN